MKPLGKKKRVNKAISLDNYEFSGRGRDELANMSKEIGYNCGKKPKHKFPVRKSKLVGNDFYISRCPEELNDETDKLNQWLCTAFKLGNVSHKEQAGFPKRLWYYEKEKHRLFEAMFANDGTYHGYMLESPDIKKLILRRYNHEIQK